MSTHLGFAAGRDLSGAELPARLVLKPLAEGLVVEEPHDALPHLAPVRHVGHGQVLVFDPRIVVWLRGSKVYWLVEKCMSPVRIA